VDAPSLPSASRSGQSAHADATHTCTLVLNGAYPQVIHKMWGLFSTRGQDVAYLDPRSKLYERYSVSTGHHDTQSLAQREDADQDLKSWRVRYTGTENLAAFRILIHRHKMRPRPHGPDALRRPPRGSKRRSMQHPVCGLPRTHQRVEKPSLEAQSISCDVCERDGTCMGWEPAGAGRPPVPVASDPCGRR
jgi:hypothetical protein